MRLLLLEEVKKHMVECAKRGDSQLREVARSYAILSDIGDRLATGSGTGWNVAYAANGTLESITTLKCGSALWRLYPRHRHFIVLMAEINGELKVLAACEASQLHTVEAQLRLRY